VRLTSSPSAFPQTLIAAQAAPSPKSIPERDARQTVEDRVVTSTMQNTMESLHQRLEERFRRNTDRLVNLTARSGQLDSGGYDDETDAVLVASTRRAVADAAHALRRMAEGTYGICERCENAIPLERLEALPHARLCMPCQRTRAG
jgi:DnaK suppressor protein